MLSVNSSCYQTKLAPVINSSMDIKQTIQDIQINKSILNHDQIQKLEYIHQVNATVFDENLKEGCTGIPKPYYAKFSFKKDTQPPPVKVWAPQYNQKCQSLLQAKCDQLEREGVLVDPQTYNIDVRHVSPSFIQQKGRAWHKELEKCELDEI